ncbi:hypothetical protein [Nostoc sp. MS1]|nr:hypothetical protein [Nostoc sp. MS1]
MSAELGVLSNKSPTLREASYISPHSLISLITHLQAYMSQVVKIN